MKGMTYLERCQEAGLETLEERRNTQDMTQTFKIMKGIDKVDREIFFNKRENQPRTRQAGTVIHGICQEKQQEQT